jgi:tetratricopeptide (TPR) repeat protein
MAHPCIVKPCSQLRIHAAAIVFGGAASASDWVVLVKHFCFLAVVITLFPATALLAAHQMPGPPALAGPPVNGQYAGGLAVGTENLFVYVSVEVDVKAPDDAVPHGPVYVSLMKPDGQVVMTTRADNGKARFNRVPKSELTAEVVAAGYETAKKAFEVGDRSEIKVAIDLRPMVDREAAAADRGIAALNSKAQKDVRKALEALRENKINDARTALEAAQRSTPGNSEIEYLYGLCESRANNEASARSHWTRALDASPNHLSALLALGQDSLHQHKPAEAMQYLSRAETVEPSSWRVHLLLAQAYYDQRNFPEAVDQAERTLELGHDRAVSVQPLLAHALFQTGEKDRGIQVLRDYVQSHPSDPNAAKLLASLTAPPAANSANAVGSGDVTNAATAVPVPSNWLPPDVDEKTPPVEAGASCSLEEVVQKAEDRLLTFVHDVDRFTATETVVHESINKYGIASQPEKRKFDYVVSIQDLKPGYLGVTEFRNGGGAQTEFPDGIVTSGLPALVLIFHPYYAPNYEMSCEGLARTTQGLAWQVHFRQKPGKPNAIKTYQLGIDGPSYSVALKGRAWISADTYQILRMETDIVAPIPEIKLLAEHTAVEYGPVRFQKAGVNLWVPESAEVYFAWRGHQVHRRHSFSNYLLFGIDENQRISAPKNLQAPPDPPPANPPNP